MQSVSARGSTHVRIRGGGVANVLTVVQLFGTRKNGDGASSGAAVHNFGRTRKRWRGSSRPPKLSVVSGKGKWKLKETESLFFFRARGEPWYFHLWVTWIKWCILFEFMIEYLDWFIIH